VAEKEKLLTAMERKGLVQVFTGNGKGKTTAALGLILRASGHNLKIFCAFFMKGDYTYGEFTSFAKLPNVEVTRFGLNTFTDPANLKPEEIKEAEAGLKTALEAMVSGKYDIVLMDEVNVAVGFGLIPVEDVLSLIEQKPARTELILTGRYAHPKIIAAADLVTEMTKIKHPYDKGISAREGIEY